MNTRLETKRGSEENLGPAGHHGAWGYGKHAIRVQGGSDEWHAERLCVATCATSGGTLAHVRALPGSMCSGWFVYFLVAQTRLQAWIQGDSGGDTPARKHAHAHGSQLMNVRRCCGIRSLSPARTRAGQHYGAVLSVLAASLGAGAVRLPLPKNNAPAAAAATATITC